MRLPRPLALALWATCALALAVLAIWCLALPDRTPPVFPEGDPAVIELYTWYATHGVWTLGPYSRFGWHHPGPFSFYLLAPFYAVSGHHTLALDAGALAINLAAFTLIAWAAMRVLERRVALAILVSLSWYAFQIARLLTSAWNPHVLLIPLFALVIIAAIVMAGRLSCLPLMVGLGSFVAQTHVGLAPCVLVVCACAAAGGLGRADRQTRWRWLAAAFIVTALLWWPAIVEWRNMLAIAQFFGPSGPTHAGTPFLNALAAWSQTLTAAARMSARVPYGNVREFAHTPLLAAMSFAEIVLLALVAWRWQRQRRVTESSLAWLCVVASAIALVSISRIRGGLFDHLVGWVATLGVLNVGVLIGAALTRADERWFTRTRWFERACTAIAPLAAIALVIAVAAYGGSRIEWQRQEVVRKAANGRTPVQALYQELRGALGRARIRKPLLRATMLSWARTAGIGLQLTKKDVPYASDLVWLLGPQVTPRGDEDVDITIADTATRHELARRAGDCMLIERHGTSIHLLALPPERFTAITCVAP